jgi:hypothetical protein
LFFLNKKTFFLVFFSNSILKIKIIPNDMFILVRSHVPEPERHEFFSYFFIYLYIVEKSNLILKFFGF